jgi:hypothetical protein
MLAAPNKHGMVKHAEVIVLPSDTDDDDDDDVIYMGCTSGIPMSMDTDDDDTVRASILDEVADSVIEQLSREFSDHDDSEPDSEPDITDALSAFLLAPIDPCNHRRRQYAPYRSVAAPECGIGNATIGCELSATTVHPIITGNVLEQILAFPEIQTRDDVMKLFHPDVRALYAYQMCEEEHAGGNGVNGISVVDRETAKRNAGFGSMLFTPREVAKGTRLAKFPGNICA